MYVEYCNLSNLSGCLSFTINHLRLHEPSIADLPVAELPQLPLEIG